MSRTGTFQTGKFDVKPGMAFVMPDMPEICNRSDIQAHKHPWFILGVYQDYVTTVMCTTIECKEENKARFKTFIAKADSNDITKPCPPMDPSHERFGGISMKTATIIPKQELFTHRLKICNENTKERNFTTEGMKSLCMDETTVQYLANDIENFLSEHGYSWTDIYGCESAEYDFYCLDTGDDKSTKYKTKEAYNKAFGWKHLPDANPFAAYPFEDQMHDYEKADPKLLTIARRKKTGTRKHRVDPPMDYLSEIDKARDTSYDSFSK